MAAELEAKTIDFNRLNDHVLAFDIIIAAIPKRIEGLSGQFAKSKANHLLVDLSVPAFFDKTQCTGPRIELLTLSDANKIIDSSLKLREASVPPEAESILARHMHEFMEWSKLYAKSDTIKKFKGKPDSTLGSLSAFSPHARRNEGFHPQKEYGPFCEIS